MVRTSTFDGRKIGFVFDTPSDSPVSVIPSVHFYEPFGLNQRDAPEMLAAAVARGSIGLASEASKGRVGVPSYFDGRDLYLSYANSGGTVFGVYAIPDARGLGV